MAPPPLVLYPPVKVSPSKVRFAPTVKCHTLPPPLSVTACPDASMVVEPELTTSGSVSVIEQSSLKVTSPPPDSAVRRAASVQSETTPPPWTGSSEAAIKTPPATRGTTHFFSERQYEKRWAGRLAGARARKNLRIASWLVKAHRHRCIRPSLAISSGTLRNSCTLPEPPRPRLPRPLTRYGCLVLLNS